MIHKSSSFTTEIHVAKSLLHNANTSEASSGWRYPTFFFHVV